MVPSVSNATFQNASTRVQSLPGSIASLMVKQVRGRLATSVREALLDTTVASLQPHEHFAKIAESRGKGQFLVTLSTTADPTVSTPQALVTLPPKFRNALWIHRGTFVVVALMEDAVALAAGRMTGQIQSILLRDQIKELKRAGRWPVDFDERPLPSDKDSDSVASDEDSDSADSNDSDNSEDEQ